MVQVGGKGMVGETSGSESMESPPGRREMRLELISLSSSPLLYILDTPAHGMLPPIFKMVLLFPVKPRQKHPRQL